MKNLPILITIVVALLAACGTNSPTGPKGSFSLELSPSSVSAKKGGASQVTITINRTNGLDEAIALSLENAPNGVTGTFAPESTVGDSSTLTLNINTNTQPDDYTINIQGKGSSSKVVALSLKVTEAKTPQSSKVEIREGLTPTRTSMPPFDDGKSRSVVRLEEANGSRPAEFVENEVLLMTDDEKELAAFLKRWQGEVLQEIDFAEAGLNDLQSMYLVRVNATAVDDSTLVDNILKISPEVQGDLRVSSQEGLNLLALFAQEAANGLTIGINWLTQSDSFMDGISNESSSGPTDQGYSSNAFDWQIFKLGSSPNIGVTNAWQMLELTNKLNNKVKIAILDGGFAGNQDFPANWAAYSIFPGKSPKNSTNLMSCGGNDCPWHGTAVAMAAAGVADNGFGAAGVAGPVADLITVYTTGDFFMSIAAVALAADKGADIINMSYHTPVPAFFSPTVIPFNAVTTIVRATGTLLFAAAGNDGEDVDAEDCFGVCWEETWFTPCENAGVICVGGIDNDKGKASGSNYGSKEVDIFAPYRVFVGPDPDNSGNMARRTGGTSVSSPFAAGVAALIWAADPNLSANQVESILMSTARSSNDSKVNRIVNAHGAVRQALGNIEPTVDIIKPTNGISVEHGGIGGVKFEAEVFDFEDQYNCCEVTWTSSLDGFMGKGLSIEHALQSVGTHIITATIEDSQGAKSSDQITIIAKNTPPTVQIIRPTSGESIYQNVPYILQGKALDTNHLGGVPCHKLVWTSSKAGDPSATGCGPSVTFTTLGPRTLTLKATDNGGAVSSSSVGITVVPAPQLWVAVKNPVPDHAILEGEALKLRAEISQDFELPSSYEWRLYTDQTNYTVIASGDVVLSDIPFTLTQFVPIIKRKIIPTKTWTPSVSDANKSFWVQVVVDGVESDRIAISVIAIPR